MPDQRPLHGIRVLDFSTLLPGPLAGLILADAGAEVIKVERPEKGEEMRGYVPRFGDTSANYALLNRGKRCVTADLKAKNAFNKLTPLLESADVLIEQFRPGVMDRLGFGYEAVKSLNPSIVYCSITGYGQEGPLRDEAGHDVNYLAQSGLLMLGGDQSGKPVIPPGLIADIGGGTLPAILNILLALRQAEKSGQGTYLDIAMTDGLFAWSFWAQGMLAVDNQTARPGNELLSGGSPRYQIYRTADDCFVAAAPLEQKFWELFCEIVELPTDLRDDRKDPHRVIDEVGKLIATKSANHWRAAFHGKDVCATVAATLKQAQVNPHFQQRGLFEPEVHNGSARMPALPTPLAPVYRRHKNSGAGVPPLGEGNETFLASKDDTRES